MAVPMSMVSARVPEAELARAQKVLEQSGVSVSELIRSVIEYTSQTGEVPDLRRQQEERARAARLRMLDETLHFFEGLAPEGAAACAEPEADEGLGERHD